MKHLTLAGLLALLAVPAQAQTFGNTYEIDGTSGGDMFHYTGYPGGGGVFASTRMDQAIVLTRVGPDGAVMWSKSYATNTAQFIWYDVQDVGPLANGDNYVLASVVPQPWGTTNWALMRLDADGDLLWSKVLSYDPMIGGDYNGCSRVMERMDGSLLVNISTWARIVLSAFTATADPLWSTSYSAFNDTLYNKNPSFDLVPTQDGGAIVCGKDRDWPFMMKADVNGTAVWGRSYPVTSIYSHWRNMFRLDNGDLLIAGHSADDGGILVRLDENGVVLWMKGYDGFTYFNDMVDLGGGEFLAQESFAGFTRLDQDGNQLGAWNIAPNDSWTGGYYLGGGNGMLEVAGTVYPAGGTGIFPFVTSVPGDVQFECQGVAIAMGSHTVAGMAGMTGTSAIIQFNEPVVVLDLPVETGEQNWIIGDLCEMLTGIDEVTGTGTTITPTLLRSGEVISVNSERVLGAPRYELIEASGRVYCSARPTSTTQIKIPTAGMAAGLYLLRITDGDHVIATQRVVIQ